MNKYQGTSDRIDWNPHFMDNSSGSIPRHRQAPLEFWHPRQFLSMIGSVPLERNLSSFLCSCICFIEFFSGLHQEILDLIYLAHGQFVGLEGLICRGTSALVYERHLVLMVQTLLQVPDIPFQSLNVHQPAVAEKDRRSISLDRGIQGMCCPCSAPPT